MTYPPNWPKCTLCDLPRLDGHLTCGRITCSESDAREIMRARSWHEPREFGRKPEPQE